MCPDTKMFSMASTLWQKYRFLLAVVFVVLLVTVVVSVISGYTAKREAQEYRKLAGAWYEHAKNVEGKAKEFEKKYNALKEENDVLYDDFERTKALYQTAKKRPRVSYTFIQAAEELRRMGYQAEGVKCVK